MPIQTTFVFRFAFWTTAMALACCSACSSDGTTGVRAGPIVAGESDDNEPAGTMETTTTSDITVPVILADEDDAGIEPALSPDDHDAGIDGCGFCPLDQPLCDREAGECKACTEDAQCSRAELGAHCVEGRCVECLSDDSCTTAEASTCDLSANVCVGCLADDGCAGIVEEDRVLAVCADRHCVECTRDNMSACGTTPDGKTPLVCHSLLQTCTEKPAGMESVCIECVSDAECEEGMRCVQESYMGQNQGYVCQRTLGMDDSLLSSCGAVEARPFNFRRDGVVSIDGEEVTVCALTDSTCAAFRQFVTTPCDGVDDTSCGEPGFDDGLCRPRERKDEMPDYRCTLPCTVSEDCPRGYACNQALPLRYCDLIAHTCYADGDCDAGKRCEEGTCH